MTWEELVREVTARHPLKESKMFGMPCLKRENGKVRKVKVISGLTQEAQAFIDTLEGDEDDDIIAAVVADGAVHD